MLQWNDVDGELGYTVSRAPQGGAFVDIGSTTMNNTILVDSQAKSATTTYSYKIRTLISGGGTTLGPQLDVTTRSTSSLTPQVISKTSTQIWFIWPTISIGPYAPAEYRVYRKADAPEWTQIGTVTSIGFTDTGLTPSTNYQYQVIACTSGTAPACSKARSITTTTNP